MILDNFVYFNLLLTNVTHVSTNYWSYQVEALFELMKALIRDLDEGVDDEVDWKLCACIKVP